MKKLLGLLAVAPLTLAACGGNDTVEKQHESGEHEVAKNDIRYVEAHDDYESKLIVSGIVLSGDDDHDGYDALGKAILDAYAAKAEYGDAVEVMFTGKFDGKDFNKTISIDGVVDNTGSDTLFTTFKEILDYPFTATADLNAAGVMAKALKDAGTHMTPAPISEAGYDAFEDILIGDGSFLETTWTHTEWDAQYKLHTQFYDLDDLTAETGILKATQDANIAAFTHSYFVFEKYMFGSHDTLKLIYHHESDPTTARFVSWHATTATA